MKVKLLVIVLLIVGGFAALMLSTGTERSRQQEYAQALANARGYAEQEIPYVSVQWYLQAIGMENRDETVYREYMAQAEKLGREFYDAAVKNYIPSFPNSPTAYEELCEQQYASGDYQSVIATAKQANEHDALTQKIVDLYYDCVYRYRYVATGMDEAESFLGDYAKVCYGGNYGILKSSGAFLLAPNYLDVAEVVGSTTAVKDEQECYIINLQGYKIARTSAPVDSMSFLSANHILVSRDGRWGYTDTSLVIPDTLPYEAATNYGYGVAAVKSNGRWALVDREDRMLTDYVFEDVILSEANTCINGGVIFAKQNGKYYMFNDKGELLHEQGFDDARLFEDADSLAAVCVDGAWGFVDRTGTMVIQPQFTDARSFSIGLAPVSRNGSWGYINPEGAYCVEAVFEDAKPFATNGIAAVKESGVWNYIQLLGYYTN